MSGTYTRTFSFHGFAPGQSIAAFQRQIRQRRALWAALAAIHDQWLAARTRILAEDEPYQAALACRDQARHTGGARADERP